MDARVKRGHDDGGFHTCSGYEACLAAISVSILAQRSLRTKYRSEETFPSLTSCVHCSSGILMPKALSIAKATSRKSRLSMPRSLMAWLSGLILSASISQVSAIISATVSYVDAMLQPLRKLRGTIIAGPEWQDLGDRTFPVMPWRGGRAPPPDGRSGVPGAWCGPAAAACNRDFATVLKPAGRPRYEPSAMPKSAAPV